MWISLLNIKITFYLYVKGNESNFQIHVKVKKFSLAKSDFLIENGEISSVSIIGILYCHLDIKDDYFLMKFSFLYLITSRNFVVSLNAKSSVDKYSSGDSQSEALWSHNCTLQKHNTYTSTLVMLMMSGEVFTGTIGDCLLAFVPICTV